MLSTKLKEAAGNGADATLYVDDVFSTWLYTGTGTTQTITNGIDLAGKGGMVWIKERNFTDGHQLIDTNRGAGYALSSNDSFAVNYSPTGLTNFNSTGFSVGSSSYVNSSSYNYASWTFRKAAKFFDVVTYTGTGSARTIAHSLGVAPGMVIVKRTDATKDWQVYHRSLTSAAYSMQLNLTAAQASAPTVWNSTAPTSSVFSVGTDSTVNASGGTYVAYLYAHDTSSTGIIQCGTFTGGTWPLEVNLGWEPQFVLVKAASTASSWWMLDTMRGLSQTQAVTLRAETSQADADIGANYIGVTSTGFILKTSAGGMGFGGANNIYMAIRRPNKPPTAGTQVFASATTTNDSLYSTTNFPVDMVMDFARTGGSTRGVKSRLTGDDPYMQTSSAGSEFSSATLVKTFQSNTGVAGGIAGGGVNLVIEAFARAPGFFDAVCYTGTGSATTQAHNLTVVPELMIVKERSAANDWWVYMSSVGNTKYSVLNSTAIPVTSATAWNNTTPTASVFSIGTGANVNASAQTFVAYLFATLAGISKVGSYTGNGTGQAIACGFSAGARFVLIKRTDAAGAWYTFDSARGLTSGSSPYLLLNSTAAEVTGNNGVYASTGGFTLGSTASTTTNINGASYIYLSVA